MDKIIRIIKFLLFFIIVLILISIFKSNEKQLGNGYWYDIEGKRIFGPNIDIPPCVERYKYNSKCIIVEQKPYNQQEDIIYERTYNYPIGRNTTYYWIILKTNNTYYGPILYEDMQIIIQKEKIDLKF